MIAPFLLTLLLQAETAPMLPAGLSGAFVRTAYSVEQKLATEQFEAASLVASRLPNSTLTVSWDDSLVPESRKTEFARQRDKAIAEWSKEIGAHITIAAKGDISFSFAEKLPNDAGGLPLGAQFEFPESPGDPHVRVTLGLKRLVPPQPVTGASIHNEVAFAIAQYFGVERANRFLSLGSRSDENAEGQTVPVPNETALATSALSVASDLRRRAEQHVKSPFATPHINLGATTVEGLTGVQGQPLGFEIQVKNEGTSDLALRVEPDCGCLRPQSPEVIKPGESSVIQASVNTNDFVGHLEHSLLVYSNDATTPLIRVPVKMFVEPLYRFVRPGAEVVQLGSNGASADIYMILSNKTSLQPLTASVEGATGSVTISPWSGVLHSDPEDPDQPKKGFKLHVQIAPSSVPGRIPAQLLISTDNEDYRLLRTGFYLQHGIVSLPGQVYLGQVSAEPAHFSFLVSRPGAGFKIVKVVSESPALVNPTFVAARGDYEYRVDMDFNGHADPGQFTSTVTVYTSDPSQSKVTVPVRMVIK